jgi:hypothetical protein
MHLSLANAALAAAAVAITGCATVPEACTQIAARSGVGVTVAAELAPQVTGVHLIVCWSGQCVEDSVELSPGTTAVDQGCESPETDGAAGTAGPDTACSAVLEPDGTLVGFLDIPDLPAEQLEITALASTADGGMLPERTTTAPAELVFPNGPGCGGEAPQVSVTLDRDGLHADDDE